MAAYIAENDNDMQKFLQDKYPMAVHLDDAFQLTAEEWAECLNNLQPPPQMVLVTGGTPCGDVGRLRPSPGLRAKNPARCSPSLACGAKLEDSEREAMAGDHAR